MSTVSSTVSATAPTLTSVWIDDVSSPMTTVREFQYGEGGRGSSFAVAGTAKKFAGREFPVWDFGVASENVVTLTIIVPYGETWVEDLEYLQNVVMSRKAWMYRDDRGRLLYGAATVADMDDQPYGTHVPLTIGATNFTEEVESGLVLFTAIEG